MKIKELLITRYGPLPNTGRITLHNFNLFWGKNEDGKTLTIDALVKLLLGRNVKGYFERIDRVEEEPEGYAIIEDDDGKEIKLPEKGNLTSVAGLTPPECRNIFIIRNSDLSIARESEFYTNVTTRLTGLRTEEISSIKKKLRELGKLTRPDSNASLSDSEEFGKIKYWVKKAGELTEEIDSLQDETKRGNFDELEETYVRHVEELDRIRQQIESIEDARKREEYEKGKEALERLEEALKSFKDLEIYNEGDEQLWRACERDIQTYSGDKEGLFTELKRKEKDFKGISEKLDEKEREFRVFDERKKELDDEIKPELAHYKMEVGKVKREETKSRFFTVAAIISVVLLSISILGVIMNPLPIFYGLLVSFLIATITFATLRFSFTQKKAHLAAVFERIRLSASRFELGAQSPEEIHSNIRRFDEEYSTRATGLEGVRGEKRVLEERVRRLEEEGIPEIEERLRIVGDKIGGVRRRSGEESLEEYTKKLKSKRGYETSIEKQQSILGSLFSKKGEQIEDNISFWEEEIVALKEYEEKSRGIKYDEHAISELRGKRNLIEGEIEEVQGKMASFQGEMREVERKANEILQLEEEYLHCNTLVDLQAIKDELQGFINKNESNRENVLGVMEIFEEIEMEEKEKISELFGQDSPISKYFAEITDSLYEEVTFNQEIGKIEVRRKDGVVLDAEKLSGGAYDQLYLSIRLALGEKLLKGKKGFFIMDDPFVKADPDRLQRQVETLKKICKLGWQVVYFSAKGEIRDALKEDVQRDAINYVEVKSTFP